jgi:Hypoxia induced protein conserved region
MPPSPLRIVLRGPARPCVPARSFAAVDAHPLVKLAFFGVILVLIFGIGSMAFGRDTAEDMVKGNKLMRLRVEIQAIALALIVTALLLAKYW